MDTINNLLGLNKVEDQVEGEIEKERDQVDQATGGYFTTLLHGTWQQYAEALGAFEGVGLIAEVVLSIAAVFGLWYVDLTLNNVLDKGESAIGGVVGAENLQWFGDITYLSKVESIARLIDSYLFGGFDFVNGYVHIK